MVIDLSTRAETPRCAAGCSTRYPVLVESLVVDDGEITDRTGLSVGSDL
jgi:hypothetical protein